MRDEREGLSASVFEVANGLNELMGGKMNSSAAICRKMYILLLDRPFEPFRSQTFIETPPFHRQNLEDVSSSFEAPVLLLCEISLVSCHKRTSPSCWLKGVGFKTFNDKAESKKRRNKLYFHQFFFLCLPAREGSDGDGLLGLIDS